MAKGLEQVVRTEGVCMANLLPAKVRSVGSRVVGRRQESTLLSLTKEVDCNHEMLYRLSKSKSTQDLNIGYSSPILFWERNSKTSLHNSLVLRLFDA
ncbi:hypothetical protein AVEN_201021-1 [Araneus ventricosus]|uniref:Uncharacterized protein n=1 Tax=Araneus ventricosus TaxID=182803 RepID=A0A4Y2XDK7_ARAVE|nr:hypothetical protein AVEN_201021-1 [Araneus ventricosus]